MDKMYATIDAYIKDAPEIAQEPMRKIRAMVHEEAPAIEERMSWQMPTFYLKGNVIHFAAHKKHLGFYPGESGVLAFLKKSTEYKSSKGAIQLPYDKPMPYDLIREIIQFRIKENLE